MVEVPRRTDAFIVGGGPAGLAAAIALRKQGFDVTVADPAQPPVDKTCGEGLMPDALETLARLGVEIPRENCFPFRGIRFLGADQSVDASFQNGAAFGMRRTILHQALVDRAEESGARLLWGVTVKGLSESGVQLHDREVAARWVIGADGESSRVRHWARLDAAWRKSSRFGFRRHYRIAPWADCVEIYWGADCQIYVTAVGHDQVCVALISRDSHLRLSQVLPQFPAVFDKLRHAEAITPERGAVSATRYLKKIHRGRVVLIGDASGSVDAITGEGLRLSFGQALALAPALAKNDLSAYVTAHRRMMFRPAFMSDLMLSLDRSEWLRKRVLAALAAEPHLFAKQLAMHVGMSSPADFIRKSLWPLSRRILFGSRTTVKIAMRSFGVPQ